MEPIEFKGANVAFGENQPEYNQLPALRKKDGKVVTCWGLTWRERIKILFTGKMWISLHTFNNPITPMLPSTDKPVDIINE